MAWVLFSALLLGSVTEASPRDWRYHARRLTGFNEATQKNSLRTLKKTPDLEQLLRPALQTRDRYLALDVISTLSMEQMLPDLFTASTLDESGSVVLAINALLTPENRGEIIQHYEKQLLRLSVAPLSVPSTVAVLDVLGRLKHRLPEEQLESFMDSGYPQIRSAAVYYARLIRKDSPGPLYRHTLERGLQDPDEATRVRTQMALESQPLPPEEKGLWASLRRMWSRPTWKHRALIPPSPRDLVTTRLKRQDENPRKLEICQKTYEAFFAKPTIDIRVVFGYKDARPSRFVGDRYEAAWFASYLTAPCRAGWHACGFSPDPKDPAVFRKRMNGPDDKPREISLRLAASAAGPDDDENRSDPFQKWLTEKTEQAFFEGLRSADVVFYNGHSRDGGGPDFAPPTLAADMHVDYDRYAKHKPGMARLLAELPGAATLKLLGFFSCASTDHFSKAVWNAKESVAVVSSPKLIYYSDALRNMLAGVSAILGEECQTDFGLSLRSKAEVGSSYLDRFFKVPAKSGSGN